MIQVHVDAVIHALVCGAGVDEVPTEDNGVAGCEPKGFTGDRLGCSRTPETMTPRPDIKSGVRLESKKEEQGHGAVRGGLQGRIGHVVLVGRLPGTAGVADEQDEAGGGVTAGTELSLKTNTEIAEPGALAGSEC